MHSTCRQVQPGGAPAGPLLREAWGGCGGSSEGGASVWHRWPSRWHLDQPRKHKRELPQESVRTSAEAGDRDCDVTGRPQAWLRQQHGFGRPVMLLPWPLFLIGKTTSLCSCWTLSVSFTTVPRPRFILPFSSRTFSPKDVNELVKGRTSHRQESWDLNVACLAPTRPAQT